MSGTKIIMKGQDWSNLHGYLIGDPRGYERGAFGFLRECGQSSFELRDLLKMEQEFVEHASGYHLALTDYARATVIKRAHDIGGTLVEFHSHPGSHPAQFSVSDWAGFKEWVPHILWRLPGRPYMAVVVSDQDFDGIWWMHTVDKPSGNLKIEAGSDILQPTGLSLSDDGGEGLDGSL